MPATSSTPNSYPAVPTTTVVKDSGKYSDTELKITKTTILNEKVDPEVKRQEILEYYEKTFDLEEKLYQTLKDTSCFYKRYEQLRHPIIFYYGHTATFFINKLVLGKLINARLNPYYETMFAVGVDEMSWDDLLDTHYNWPSVQEVTAYRQKAREVVTNLIKTMPLTLPITWDSNWWIVLMGIEHARIHIETSSVIIRQAPVEDINQDLLKFWNSYPVRPSLQTIPSFKASNDLVTIAKSKLNASKPYEDGLYGWDNEYGENAEDVEEFKASKYLVSNYEFLEFVQDRAYEQEKYWTKEGWSWRTFTKATYPKWWIRTTDQGNILEQFKLRNFLEEVPMQWDWPVEVNNLEAKAFCNWKAEKTGKKIRLPTENEWYALRNMIPTDQADWKQAPGNINLEYYSTSTPVDKYKQVEAPYELYDVIGNVWQHTETWIDAFKGFRVHKIYDDFSLPTFDSKHNMIKGGSWISTGNEATKLSRYAFRRHFFQHAGFRYVEGNDLVPQTPSSFAIISAAAGSSSVYESDQSASEYNEFHYGPEEYLGIPNFNKRVAEICVRLAKEHGKSTKKALDIGCSVGRASFELARHFDKVLGLDFSANFIQIGTHLKTTGMLRYKIVDEGDISITRDVKLQDKHINIDEQTAQKVDFFQGDACNLDIVKYSGFDLVLAANLVCRLYNPKAFLTNIHKHINKGGLLVITSPFVFDEQFTNKELWLGGNYEKDGEKSKAVYGFEALQKLLSANFRLIGNPSDIPMVIRETARKFQYSTPQLTVWEKTN